LCLEQGASIIHQEYAIQVNYKGDVYVHAKVGFGIDREKWAAFVYFPFMNLHLNSGKYNTPFSAEVFYRKGKRDKWYIPYLSLNADIYKDKVIPTLRIKYRLIR